MRKAWPLPVVWAEWAEEFNAFDASIHPDAQVALDATWDWTVRASKGEVAGLILWGANYGAGKTHLAQAAWKALSRSGYYGTFYSAPKWFERIKDQYSLKAPEGPLFAEWCGGPYFILDDLGKEATRKESENWTREKFFKLLDGLHQSRPLMITCNLTPAQLAVWIGGAAWSRLYGMCGETGIVNMGRIPDYRIKKASGK